MPSQADVKEITPDAKTKAVRRFDLRDWQYLADYVYETYTERKRRRGDRERLWAEVDRQVSMMPDTAYKKLPNGRPDRKKLWMSEIEMPLQAQTLEILTADAQRMMIPTTGAWFTAHAEVTDEYLQRVDLSSMITGDENDVPSLIDQDNVDKLCTGLLMHQFRQLDLGSRVDRINAEAFKYGMGVGRARMQRKSVYIHEASGVRREDLEMPVLVPSSIKKTYLDDTEPSAHTVQQYGEMHIVEDSTTFEALVTAANKGSTDPNREDGGWMPKNLKGIEGDDDKRVMLLEAEGDLIVPRKTTRSLIIPGAIMTVVVGRAGAKGGSATTVVRMRFRKMPFSSYLLFPYHFEGACDVYPTSPLMKGHPLQVMATQAVNRLMDSAALKNAPPVSYDRDDQHFADRGGPVLHPYAIWATLSDVKAHTEIGGDPGAIAEVARMAIAMYGELTGVMAPRIGAQTKSHTTAFSKNQEIERGAVRTVDYVNAAGRGPITRFLHMAYQMGRAAIPKTGITYFIDAYGGFVSVDKDQLPERVTFEWFGSAGPAEEQAKAAAKIQSVGMAAQLDQLAAARGEQPTLNIANAIKQTLREGGWTDVDAITNPEIPAGANPAAPGAPGAAPGATDPRLEALQAFAGTGG